jgi:hypothetical protein
MLHDHSNKFRQLFSVTEGRETLAVMKPMAALRGWWALEARGFEWINPIARDIELVRQQAGTDEWPRDATSSLYNKTARFMLIKGKQNALKEMKALVTQIEQGTKSAHNV